MTQGEDAKLAPTQELEEPMVTVPCSWCERATEYMYRGGEVRGMVDELHGIVTCANCHKQTVFTAKGNVITYLPGKLFEEQLVARLEDSIRVYFQEALRCFYGLAFRAVPGMCRSTIEEALDKKGVKGGDLSDKVKSASGVYLGEHEIGIATAARIIGRDALHHNMSVSQTQAQVMLSATAETINYIARQPRKEPASLGAANVCGSVFLYG